MKLVDSIIMRAVFLIAALAIALPLLSWIQGTNDVSAQGGPAEGCSTTGIPTCTNGYYSYEAWEGPYLVTCFACNPEACPGAGEASCPGPTCEGQGQVGTWPYCSDPGGGGSCQTCAEQGFDTGTSPTNFPSCNNGSCRNYTCQDYGYTYGTLGCCYNNADRSDDACYTPPSCPAGQIGTPPSCHPPTCQDYGYNYGTLGCCYNNADRSDDACYTPPDVCPATPGNQSSTSECNCTDNPSGPGCAPIDVCPTTPGNQSSTASCNCTDEPSNPGCTPTDVCPTTPGNQTSISQCNCTDNPSGPGCTPTDVCPTTPGTQTSVTQCNCTDNPSGPGCSPTCVANVGDVCSSSPNSCSMVEYGSIQCDGSCSATTPPNSACSAGRDLTAGIISPSTVTPNVSTSFSALITNQGTQSTGAAFNNLFQRASSPSGTGAISLGVVNTSALGANQTRSVSQSASLPAGTWYLRACADNNASFVGSITETEENNNCGPWTEVVSGAMQPNLTAGSITPTTASQNQSVNLSSVVSNIGSGSTGANFYTLFQRSNNSSGSGAVDIDAEPTSTITAGGTRSVSTSYTFTSTGTYYVRACADKTSAASSGSITESNESDNCGPWTAVTVTANSGLTCEVEPTTVAVGGSAKYGVSGGGNGGYVWQASDGGSYGNGSAVIREFASPGTYGMQVKQGDAGAWAYCPNVTVGAGACNDSGPVSITASPTRVQQGSAATLTWNASNASGACTITGPGVNTSDSPDACTVTGSTSTGALTTQATYTISCPGGQRDTVIVNVIPKFEEF